MSAILDALSDVGYALDTPGALTRGLLAGRPGSRASGEELLDAYGLPGGPLGGFAAEMVLDPLALAGPALGAFKGLRGLSHAGNLAPLARRLGELGGAGGAAPDALDALRAAYRGTVGRPSPVADAIGRFVADEEGALDLTGFGRGRAPFTPDEVLAATGRRPAQLGFEEASEAYQPWVDQLVPDERSALGLFTSGPQDRISHALRRNSTTAGGHPYDPFGEPLPGAIAAGTPRIDTPGDVLSEVVPYLDSALSRSAAPRDLMTYRLNRRFGDLTPENAREMIGRTVSDPSYLSTTITPWRRFYGSSPSPDEMLMDILLPKGSPGGYIEGLSNYKAERELLLPRDLSMRVADVRGVPAVKHDHSWYRLDPAGRPMPTVGNYGDELFRDMPGDEVADWLRQGVYGDVRVPDEFLARDWEERLARGNPERGSIQNVLLWAGEGDRAAHLPGVRRRTPREAWEQLVAMIPEEATDRLTGGRGAREVYGSWARRALARDEYPEWGTLKQLERTYGVPATDLLRSIPRGT